MNLFASIETHARNRPSHPAVIDGERVLTYRDLHRLMLATAARLAASGVGQGDVVGVHLDHSADHLVMVYALARLGAINLPLEHGLAAPERLRAIERFAARFVISHGEVDSIGAATTIRIDDSWRSASDTVDPPPMAAGSDLPLLFS